MIKFTIPLPPITKKNSQQIRYRYGRDRTTGARKQIPYIAPSQAFKDYEQAAMWFVPKLRQPNGIDFPVNVKCIFYVPTLKPCDLTNHLEAIDDIMVKAGLLADDNYKIIESHDGSRVRYDKNNPRTEVYIERIKENENENQT